ncbi:hypothetical protein Q4485_03275 [Granulosicoccaceae sp. 1_MG-2023]|nr:hypothetical protein [Granulosicoccaceae sp. 1_MG-2023]
MTENDEMPRWDVAIEGMVRDEFRKQGTALKLGDFRRLAADYDFRLDDIMETVFLMLMHEAWQYSPDAADTRSLSHDVLVELCTKKRLNDQDLSGISGGFAPRD